MIMHDFANFARQFHHAAHRETADVQEADDFWSSKKVIFTMKKFWNYEGNVYAYLTALPDGFQLTRSALSKRRRPGFVHHYVILGYLTQLSMHQTQITTVGLCCEGLQVTGGYSGLHPH